MNNQLKEIEEEIECEVAGALSKKITEENGYKLEKIERITYKISPVKFREAYPELFEKVIKVVKKKAQEELERENHNKVYIKTFLDKISTPVKTNVQYKVTAPPEVMYADNRRETSETH